MYINTNILIDCEYTRVTRCIPQIQRGLRYHFHEHMQAVEVVFLRTDCTIPRNDNHPTGNGPTIFFIPLKSPEITSCVTIIHHWLVVQPPL